MGSYEKSVDLPEQFEYCPDFDLTYCVVNPLDVLCINETCIPRLTYMYICLSLQHSTLRTIYLFQYKCYIQRFALFSWTNFSLFITCIEWMFKISFKISPIFLFKSIYTTSTNRTIKKTCSLFNASFWRVFFFFWVQYTYFLRILLFKLENVKKKKYFDHFFTNWTTKDSLPWKKDAGNTFTLTWTCW